MWPKFFLIQITDLILGLYTIVGSQKTDSLGWKETFLIYTLNPVDNCLVLLSLHGIWNQEDDATESKTMEVMLFQKIKKRKKKLRTS